MASPGPGFRFQVKEGLGVRGQFGWTVTWLAGRTDYLDELGEAGKEIDLSGTTGPSARQKSSSGWPQR